MLFLDAEHCAKVLSLRLSYKNNEVRPDQDSRDSLIDC